MSAANASDRLPSSPDDLSESAHLPVAQLAGVAKASSRLLAPLSQARRNAALEAMARALEEAQTELLAANFEDRQRAVSLAGNEALPSATLARLELDAEKLCEMVAQVRSVAALPDPLGRVLDALELDNQDPCSADKPDETPASDGAQPKDVGNATAGQGLHLQKISVPLGVLAVIFEARPDAVTQIAALALKSGNAVLLKPGREVECTAAALVHVLREALRREHLPEGAITLVLGRERAAELLQLHDQIDLVIPRGSSSLVRYVQANTHIPVLGHSEGVCHIYVDRVFDPELALRVIDDAKTDYPSACNAVETVLLHRDIAATFLPVLARCLRGRGVSVHADADAHTILLHAGDDAGLGIDDWHTEYGQLELAIGVVDSLDAAIDHIHRHGSSHTESILTEDPEAAERFLTEVDAAGVFHNASTRFADGFRYGFGAEVGISTSKLHARGPVGLGGLTTYKYILRGHGHVAGEYRGVHARAFTHHRR